MKQTLTLFAALACSVLSAFGQTTSENFNTASTISTLEGRCWQFFNVKLLAATAVDGTNSLAAQPVDKINNAGITTPYANLTTSSSITFQYQMQARNSSSERVITVRLQDYAGTYYPVGTVTIAKGTDPFLGTFSGISPQNGVFKIVVTIDGSGGGSNDLYIDNFNFGGELNYNTPYACAAAATLPIKLKSFQGLVTEQVQLSWVVADNEAGSYFEVERSASGKGFTTIAPVNTTDAAGDQTYSYKDGTSGNAYYRLKLVSKGRTVTYSNVLLLKTQGVATITNAISLLQNPVQSTLRFSFASNTNANTEVAVYNMTGVKVYQTTFNALKGINTISTTLDGSVRGGTYVLEVTNTTNRSVAKFVKY